MGGKRVKQLVIVPDYDHHSGEEFEEIREELLRRRPELKVWVTSFGKLRKLQYLKLGSSSLVVSLRCLGKWRPWRGELRHGVNLTKSQQLQRMKEAGIEVGRFEVVAPGIRLDAKEWGPVVVVKPEVGRRGRGVRVMRTGKVRWEKFEGVEEKSLVQEFVYTGRYPVSYRVTTFCGRAMFVYRSENPVSGGPLEAVESSRSFSGKSIVATSAQGDSALVDDEEVRRFGEKVARLAFPEIPCLGIDIMRDERDGRLVVAEANCWGETWHFSSELGRKMQEENGFRFEEQYGLVEQATCALLEMLEKEERVLHKMGGR